MEGMEKPNRRSVLKGIVGLGAAALGVSAAEARSASHEQVLAYNPDAMQKEIEVLENIKERLEKAEKDNNIEEQKRLAEEAKKQIEKMQAMTKSLGEQLKGRK